MVKGYMSNFVICASRYIIMLFFSIYALNKYQYELILIVPLEYRLMDVPLSTHGRNVSLRLSILSLSSEGHKHCISCTSWASLSWMNQASAKYLKNVKCPMPIHSLLVQFQLSLFNSNCHCYSNSK